MEANLNLLKMDLMDMNWALLSNWRDLLSTIFDQPEKVQLLERCKSVIITYNSNYAKNSKHPEMVAIYLQGWLAAALGAKYRQTEYFDSNLLISYFGKYNPLVMALEPRNELNQPQGAILGMELKFASGDSYTIMPMHELAQALVHESSTETCALPYTLPLPNVFSGMNFLNEILYQNAGEQYRKMLRMISQLHIEENNGQ